MTNKKKYCALAVLVALFLWQNGLKKVTYCLLWGKYTGEHIVPEGETFTAFPDTDIWTPIRISGYDIEYRLRRKYTVRGRIVYIDWNDGILNTWYHGAGNKYTYLYNAVASIDVSVIHGKTAEDGNWQKIKFSHEERGLIWQYWGNDVIAKDDEINNNHVIPANHRIRHAIASLKKGDTVLLEGYLMDWRGTGEFSGMVMETAIAPGDIHQKILFGGRPGAGLCRQFYITAITANGYRFE